MSVASKNPFALLGDGVDDSVPSAPAAPAAPAPPAPVPARDNQKASKGPASRGGKYYQRGGGAAKTSTLRGDSNTNQNGIEDAESAPKKFDGGRGRGRGGRGAQRGGRRPFDRHSATGKTDSGKKVHQGWGGDDGNTELQAETAATVDAAAEATSPATGAAEWGIESGGADAWAISAPETTDAPAPTEDKPEGRPRREEEEDNTLTLEQYLAQQKEKEGLAVPKLEVRRANEGANADIWKDVVPLQKGEEDAYFVGKNKAAPKARTKKEEKVFIEIEPRFERPNTRGGRGRGDGSRGRGGRGGRGGNRGGRQDGNGRAPTALNVDDETAFPSLS